MAEGGERGGERGGEENLLIFRRSGDEVLLFVFKVFEVRAQFDL